MSQQFAQGRYARSVQGGAHRHLHRLQVDHSRLTPAAEDDPQQAIYFLTDFLVDRLPRFLSATKLIPSAPLVPVAADRSLSLTWTSW